MSAAEQATAKAVVLLFPGQGAQYPGMARGLYGPHAEFTAALDDVFTAMGARGNELRQEWLNDRPRIPLDHVTRSQPLLFALGYALGQVLIDLGVRPAGLLGHSIGEVAAATVAGVFTLEDACGLVLERVDQLVTAPPGGMLAVAGTMDSVATVLSGRLGEEVWVAAINSPRQTVLAGSDAALETTLAALTVSRITARRVPSLSPFHSPLLAPMIGPGRDAFAGVRIHAPRWPVWSCYTGAPMGAPQLSDPGYWASQPVAQVLFWPALDALLQAGDTTLIDVGPGQSLAVLARRHPHVEAGRSRVLAQLPARPGPAGADPVAAAALAAALTSGGHVHAPIVLPEGAGT